MIFSFELIKNQKMQPNNVFFAEISSLRNTEKKESGGGELIDFFFYCFYEELQLRRLLNFFVTSIALGPESSACMDHWEASAVLLK